VSESQERELEWESEEVPQRRKRRVPSFFWPLVLIGAGVLLLLANLGYVPWQSWNALWRLWPVLLIALGIDVLIGRRSMLGAIVSGLLILALIAGAVALVVFAPNIPALSSLTQASEWQTEHVEHPLASTERASIHVDWTSAPGYLSALSDSSNLIEGDVTYRGQLIFDVDAHGAQTDVLLDSQYSGPWFGPPDFLQGLDARWDVMLSPDVAIDLTLDSGSGSCDFDLSDLQIGYLFLDSGSGSIDLALPPDSTFNARIDSGSGSLDITLPRGVGARVVVDSGSGSFRPDERFRLVEGRPNDDGVWETEDYDAADHVIDLEIDQGSGSIRID